MIEEPSTSSDGPPPPSARPPPAAPRTAALARAATAHDAQGAPDEAEALRSQLATLEVIYQLATALAAARCLAEVYPLAIDGLLGVTPADRAAVLLFDAAGVMRFQAHRDLSARYRAAVEGHSPWTRDARDPQPVAVPDVRAEASLAAYRDLFRDERIGALLFVPLVHGAELLGKFMLYYAAPHAFDAGEVRLAQTIAHHVALAVARARSDASLRLYREIFANSSDGIAVVDDAGCYLEQNAAHHALVGYDAAELAGCTPAVHLGDEVFARIAAALAERGRFRAEVRSVARDGVVRSVDLSAFTIPASADGAPARHVGIKRDVSEQRALAEQLEAERRLLDGVLRQLPVGVILREPAGRLRMANDLAAEILGCPIGLHPDYLRDRIRRVDGALVPPDELPIARAMRGETAFEDDFLWIRPDGGRVMLRVRARPVFDDAGRLAFAALVLADVTAQREAQSSLAEAVRARDEFLSIASHELNTPLTSLQLNLERLARAAAGGRLRELPDERVLAILDAVTRQHARLTRLVRELLDVSRIAAGQMRLEREDVDLASVVREQCARVSADLAAAGCALALAASAPVRGRWDRLRLEQVVENLLSNAMKYGRGAPVEVSVSEREGAAVLRVQDHGIGIAPDAAARIFERYERAVSARNYGGLGLGLYIVRQIVDAHGGSVAVASAPGQGALFTVTLPASPAPANHPQG